MTCGFAQHDGAYVLGALEPDEREEFEQHLAGCQVCSQSVAELAGLPLLLDRLTPAAGGATPDRSPGPDLDPALAVPGLAAGAGPDPDPPVPGTLLPNLVRQVRRDTRRRSILMAAAAAAVGAGLTLAGTTVLGVRDGPPAVAAPSPSAGAVSTGGPSRTGTRFLTSVGGPLQADVALTSTEWGTRVELTSTEAARQDDQIYLLVIRTRAGKVEQLGTWKALPGRTLRLASGTAVRTDDITAVEVHSADGRLITTLSG